MSTQFSNREPEIKLSLMDTFSNIKYKSIVFSTLLKRQYHKNYRKNFKNNLDKLS